MANTLFTGKVYHRFDELPSTNDYAADLVAKSTPPEGTVVRAASQTAGRGQFGSRWESAAGQNLTLSVIFYPNWLEAGAQFYLSMAVSLALHDTVRHLSTTTSRPPSPEIKIKWPNDLYIGDRKAGGILIQNALSGRLLQSSVVGIGLNINQLEFDAAIPNPTSTALAFGRDFDLETVSDKLLECLERRYLQLKSGRRAAVKAEYEEQLYRLGVPAHFERADGAEFLAVILGVGADGRLYVEQEPGREEVFDLKEIRFLIN
ncbi:MAG: biotin--[acetyl-CoA-carboxylase] ligase [Lewinellaceae bacterium]|nr:biotin--[acetyl-CoA-carboxylase] ligase [Lewinellaceae bacterium]